LGKIKGTQRRNIKISEAKGRDTQRIRDQGERWTERRDDGRRRTNWGDVSRGEGERSKVTKSLPDRQKSEQGTHRANE
jgi:hypothetical protein